MHTALVNITILVLAVAITRLWNKAKTCESQFRARSGTKPVDGLPFSDFYLKLKIHDSLQKSHGGWRCWPPSKPSLYHWSWRPLSCPNQPGLQIQPRTDLMYITRRATTAVLKNLATLILEKLKTTPAKSGEHQIVLQDALYCAFMLILCSEKIAAMFFQAALM